MGYFFKDVSCNFNQLDESIIPQCSSPIPGKHQISVLEVERSLMKIHLNKSSGPDIIPNWVLRDCAPILSGPIASIFNSSIKEGFIPTLCKMAIVVPVNKILNAHNIYTDFRPISLTPTISKVFEKFVYKWILEYVSSLLDNFQFGAVKNSSTTHALIKLIDDWAKHTDNSKLHNFV